MFIDHQGKRKAKKVGPGLRGKKAAELAAIHLRAKLATGDLSILSPPVGPQITTFADYAEQWLTESIAPHRKARTEDYYRQMLKNHLTPAFGRMALADLKPAHVRGFVANKLKEGASRNTVRNMAATLRAVLYQAAACYPPGDYWVITGGGGDADESEAQQARR